MFKLIKPAEFPNNPLEKVKVSKVNTFRLLGCDVLVIIIL